MYYYTFYFTRCQCIKQQIYMNNKAESFRRFVMEIVKRIFVLLFAMLLCVLSSGTGYGAEQERKYIKWVDFGITSQAMSDAAKIDCTSHGSDHEISWIELLSLLGVKYGGQFFPIQKIGSRLFIGKDQKRRKCREYIGKSEALRILSRSLRCGTRRNARGIPRNIRF